MVALVQVAFQEGQLEEEATCKVVVLIPNKGEEYRIIGLMEVVWKIVTVIINC